jgi:UDP-glucose 4-epimerase
VTNIAELACEVAGLDLKAVTFEYTDGDRGWKGDVPVVKLDVSRILALGWSGARPSREALNSEVTRGLI